VKASIKITTSGFWTHLTELKLTHAISDSAAFLRIGKNRKKNRCQIDFEVLSVRILRYFA